MDTKVGETISAEQFNQAYPVGTTLSAEQFAASYGGGQSQDQPTTDPNIVGTQPLEREIEKATGGKEGLFNIPVLGGVLRNAVSGTEAYGRMVGGAGFEIGRAGVAKIQGEKAYEPDKGVYGVDTKTGKALVQNPFLPEEDLAKMSTSPMEGAGRTLNMMGIVAGGKNPIGITKAIINPKKFVAGKLDEAYTAATKQGAQISKADVLTDALMGKQLPKTRAAIEDFVKNNLPGGAQWKQVGPYKFTIDEIKDFTPSQAWAISKEISKTYGPNIFKNYPGASEEMIAAQAVRQAISQLLVDAAPEAKNLNKIYTVLNKILTTSNLKKLGVGVGLGGGGIFGLSQIKNLLNNSGEPVSTGYYRQ